MSLSYVELSKENLLHNISAIRALLLPEHKLVAVIKANAYGHGMREVASVIENSVDYLQVDDYQELAELRKCTEKETLVFGYVADDELVSAIRDYNAILGVFEFDEKRFQTLNSIGKATGKKVRVHLEIDALLGRLGILAVDANKCISKVKSYEHISLEALYGHFSDIEDSENLTHARAQCEQLKKISQESGVPYYISATCGILSDPKNNWGGTMIRLGIGMYGLWPSEHLKSKELQSLELKPVLSWKTKVAQVKTLPAGYPIGYGRTVITEKETNIAVIPLGYSDGYDRRFSNNSAVLIRGTRCKVLGRVAMNMFVVDVTHLSDISHEDEVVLLGKQGMEEISAEELANNIGTINYEIIARISSLLERKIV